MTVLIILLGLAISHFATGFRRWRSFDWPLWLIEGIRRVLAGGAWRASAVVLFVSLVGSGLLVWLFTALLGTFGWAVLALAAIVYTLGPRDLDEDIERLLGRDEASNPELTAGAARTLGLSFEATGSQAAAAVVRASMSRWFGVLFWFVVLGVAGAILYRLTSVALADLELGEAEFDGLTRMHVVLDWPVVALLMVSAGLCGDLDRVATAWREWRDRDEPDSHSPTLVDRLGVAIAGEDADFDAGLRSGHQLVWRMLILWLAVLSLALLAGWLV